MNKLLNLIDSRINSKLAARADLKLAPAKITRVQEGYLRADVKLAGSDTEVKGLLNKTGEKLEVGQEVKVAYQTLPSSGWIALTLKEADPLKKGGGVVVESAALLNNDNFSSFVVNKQLMLNIDAHTNLYYGEPPAFIIINGQYCLADPRTSYYDIINDESLKQKIYDNMDFFGMSFKFPYIHDNAKYINRTVQEAVYVAGVTLDSYGNMYLNLSVVYRRDQLDNGSTEATSVRERRIAIPNGTYVENVCVIPQALRVYGNDTFLYNGASTPNGYVSADIAGWIFVVFGNGTYTMVGLDADSFSNVLGVSYHQNSCFPFGSEAEKYFALGVTQRSEPVEEDV